MSKTVFRKSRKGARATPKFDSIWPDKDADRAIARLRAKNPQFQFWFAKSKKVDPFSAEEHRPEEVE